MDTETTQPALPPTIKCVTARNRQAPKPSSPQARKPAKRSSAPSETKQDRVIGMLRGKAGTTVAAIMKTTNWQKHSVHGFLAGIVRKKLGLNLVSEESDGTRVYRIVTRTPTAAARKTNRRRAG